MSIKKALAGAILAGGAVVAPFVKGETKQTNTVAKAQEIEKENKLTMPSWIPTTADGKFDEKKAKEQAEMLWAENGKDIQQYADDIKAGMPEEIAFTKYAKKLAKGDKEKEKQIHSLYTAIKETYAKREGKMKDTPVESLPASALAGLATALCVALVSSIILRPNKKEVKEMAICLGIGGIVGGLLSGISQQYTRYSQDTFIQIQKAAYDECHDGMMKNWTMTDMKTAKKMIEEASKKSDYRKAEELSRQMIYNQMLFDNLIGGRR